MLSDNEKILKTIAQTPKGAERAEILKNQANREAVLSSGANVTLYTGRVQTAPTAQKALSAVHIGLIQRKNKSGRLDGLGALGGLAERTSKSRFALLDRNARMALVGKKDDVVIKDGEPTLITDINIIRLNNVQRELSEELQDLGITDIAIDSQKLELIDMPKVKDDNYMINIWDGKGECFAISPYCHIYQDNTGLIDEISRRAKEKQGGEAVTYKKISLFDALSAYGNKGSTENSLEDGRSADKDYRYPHEHLAAWALASKLFQHNPERMIVLAKEVQQSTMHHISFEKLAKDTGQTIEDLAHVLKLSPKTVSQMEQTTKQAYLQKKILTPLTRE